MSILNRDLTSGVFSTKAGINDVVKPKKPEDAPWTLDTMFVEMARNMSIILNKAPTQGISVEYTGLDRSVMEGLFVVTSSRGRKTPKVYPLMHLKDSFLDLDLLLKNNAASEDTAQLLLLFFQVFSMLVYEIVVACLAGDVDPSLLTHVQNSVNHMIIMLFMILAPDDACKWRDLFGSLFSDIHGLKSASTPASQSKYLSDLTARKRKFDQFSTTHKCSESGDDETESKLKLYADNMMIELGKGHWLPEINNAFQTMLGDAQGASQSKQRSEQEKALMALASTELGKYSTLPDAIEAVSALSASDELAKKEVDASYLRLQTCIGDGQRLMENSTGERGRPELKIQSARGALAKFREARDERLILLQHMNTLKLNEAIRVAFKGKYAYISTLDQDRDLLNDDLEAKFITIHTTVLQEAYHNTENNAGTLVNQTAYHTETLLETIKALQKLSGPSKELLSVLGEGFFKDYVKQIFWNPHNDPWSSRPEDAWSSTADQEATKGNALAVTEENGTAMGTNLSVHMCKFSQCALIRAERLFRSYPIQVYLQNKRGDENSHHKLDEMLYMMTAGEADKLWIDTCQVAVEESTVYKHFPREKIGEVPRRRFAHIYKYMMLLGEPASLQAFNQVQADAKVANSNIKPTLLRTVLFMNEIAGSGMNPRYTLTFDPDHPFASMKFTPVLQTAEVAEVVDDPSATVEQLEEAAEMAAAVIQDAGDSAVKDADGDRHEMTIGPLSYVANENFDIKLKNVCLQMKDQIHELDNVPMLIMGYGASGSGKTTCLYGLTDPPQAGLMQLITESLTERFHSKFCKVSVREFYSIESTAGDKTDNLEYIKNMKKTIQARLAGSLPAYTDQGDSTTEMMDVLSKLFETANVLDIPDKVLSFSLTPGKSEWLYTGDDVTLIQGADGGVVTREMMAILKDCVEAGVMGKSRKVATTFLNPRSSRSHVIMDMIFSEDKEGSNPLKTLHIADFAGVENIPACDSDLVAKRYARLSENPKDKIKDRRAAYPLVYPTGEEHKMKKQYVGGADPLDKAAEDTSDKLEAAVKLLNEEALKENSDEILVEFPILSSAKVNPYHTWFTRLTRYLSQLNEHKDIADEPRQTLLHMGKSAYDQVLEAKRTAVENGTRERSRVFYALVAKGTSKQSKYMPSSNGFDVLSMLFATPNTGYTTSYMYYDDDWDSGSGRYTCAGERAAALSSKRNKTYPVPVENLKSCLDKPSTSCTTMEIDGTTTTEIGGKAMSPVYMANLAFKEAVIEELIKRSLRHRNGFTDPKGKGKGKVISWGYVDEPFSDWLEIVFSKRTVKNASGITVDANDKATPYRANVITALKKWSVDQIEADVKAHAQNRARTEKSRSDDVLAGHGKSICRYRVAEGRVINNTLREVRAVFKSCYGREEPSESSKLRPVTIPRVRQDQAQSSVLNNRNYGSNEHMVPLAGGGPGIGSGESRVPAAVRDIVELKSNGTQANAFILGVFNRDIARDRPPSVDYIPVCEIMEEMKRLQPSLLGLAWNQNPTHGIGLHPGPNLNAAILERFEDDVVKSLGGVISRKEDASPLEEIVEQIAMLKGNTDEVAVRSHLGIIINLQRVANGNTAIGTLEFLDQACKQFSTNQTFVFDRQNTVSSLTSKP